MIDAKAFGEQLADIVKAATAPLLLRIEQLEKAQAEMPEPVPGRDGNDGADGKDGAPGEKGERGEPGRDGLDVKDLFRADEGRLVAVLSDGTTKDLGVFVGSDGKDGAPGRDGADGLGFDDLEFTHDEAGRPVAKFSRGDVTKSVTLPCIIDRGPYRADQEYLKGDAVSFGGSLWIAQEKTSERPDGGAGWRLAAKKGRDAREPKVRASDA